MLFMAITSIVFVNILKISFPQKAHPISLAIKLMGLRINPLLWIMHHMTSSVGWVWVTSLSEVNLAQETLPTHFAESSSVALSLMCYSGRHQAWLFQQNTVQETAGYECFTEVKLTVALRISFLLVRCTTVSLQPVLLPWVLRHARKHSISHLPVGLFCLIPVLQNFWQPVSKHSFLPAFKSDLNLQAKQEFRG